MSNPEPQDPWQSRAFTEITPAAAPPQAPRRRGRTFLITFAATLVLAAIAVPVAVHYLSPDSGVVECARIAVTLNGGPGGDAPGTGTAQANQRAAFANSRYAELRSAGTSEVDTVAQSEGLDDAGRLAFAGPMSSTYAALAHACADHGVTLPPWGLLGSH